MKIANTTKNDSMETGAECSFAPLNPSSEWVKAVAYIIIIIVSFIGNIIVIRVFTTTQRMRTEVNFLIVNMAVADILTTLFNMSFFVRYFTRQALNLPPIWFGGHFGVFLCKFVDFIQGVSVFCCVLTLTAIAFNRFFAVIFPLKGVMNPQVTKLVIFFIWICACVLSSPTLYAMQVVKQDGEYYCVEEWAPAFDNTTTPKYYTFVIFLIMFVIPLTMITALYSCVIRRVWMRQVPGNVTQANQRLEGDIKKRVLKMLITVVVVFALCWLPFHVSLLLVNFYYGINSCDISPVMLFTGIFLGHANSAINPWIYFLFNKDYRRNMKELCQAPCTVRYTAVRVHSHTRCSTVKTAYTPPVESREVELEVIKNSNGI